MLVCTLGDLLLDVVVRLDRPLESGGDVPAAISVVPGGQGANVAAWVEVLGADSRLITKRARDIGGELASAPVRALGVDVRGPLVGGRSGTVLSLVDGGGERTMASDRGAAAELWAEEIEPGWLECDHLHVSGYLLAGEPGISAARRAVALARAAGARVSVDLASATAVADTPGSRRLLEELAPEVVFCNEAEAAAVGGPVAGTAWIVKRGAHGASFDGVALPAAPVPGGRVVDATGAGDAFAAGWIVGGPPLALEAAARCVAQVGALPRGGEFG